VSFPAWLIPLLGILIGPVFLLLRAARQFSGQVATTDASKLWDEANAMRAEYKARITELNEVVKQRETYIADLEQELKRRASA
jgi:hypothetical protein